MVFSYNLWTRSSNVLVWTISIKKIVFPSCNNLCPDSFPKGGNLAFNLNAFSSSYRGTWHARTAGKVNLSWGGNPTKVLWRIYWQAKSIYLSFKGQSFSPHLISILLIDKRKRQNRKPLSKASNVFFNHPNYTICKFHSLLRVPCDFLISISWNNNWKTVLFTKWFPSQSLVFFRRKKV